MNKFETERYKKSKLEGIILWELSAGIKKEVVEILMTSEQHAIWVELQEGKKSICYNCGAFMLDSLKNCDNCRALHRRYLGEEGTWHLFDFKKGEALQFRENKKNYQKVTLAGAKLYKELASRNSLSAHHISFLSERQILILLSLQDIIQFIPQKKIDHKHQSNIHLVSQTGSHGYLHVGRLAKKFFSEK